MYKWMYVTRNEAPVSLFYEAQTTSASVGVGEAQSTWSLHAHALVSAPH
jgi:hypothetical protein